MAQLEILNQEQIDFLIDQSEFSVDKPVCEAVKSAYNRYRMGHKSYKYNILKICSFKEAQRVCKELNRLWILKPFVSDCKYIISWIEVNRSLTIAVELIFYVEDK